MNLNKLFLRWITVFGMVMVFAVSGLGDNSNNGSCGTAENVALSYTSSGASSGSSDRYDYYTFTPTVSAILTMTISGSDKDLDTYLLTSDCNSVLIKDDSNGKNPSFTYSVTAGTTYKFLVYYYPNSGSTNYTLTLNLPAQTPPTLSVSIPDQYLTVGTAMSPIDMDNYFTPTNGDAISYTLSGTLPSGLTFNASTGVLSGTPTQSMAATSYTVTATDNDGSVSDSFLITVVAPSSDSSGGRNFTLRKDLKLYGDVAVLGNTVLCESNGAGGCQEPTGSSDGVVYNNYTNLQVAPVSYSTLTLPAGVTGANVKYARLYWQGRQAATSSSSTWSDAEKNLAKTISIRRGNSGAFTPVTADFGDFAQTYSWNYIKIYSAGADVTDFIKNNGGGTYYIENLYTETGATSYKTIGDGLGAYGAWVLAVVYEDPATSQFKDVAIFDGYKVVADLDDDDQEDPNEIVEVSVTGFYAPKAPATVHSNVYAFTGEGDRNIVGDKFWMRGAKQTNYTEIGTFNSRIDVSGVRSPNLTNNSGIDIHSYNVGTDGLGLITNEEKTAWMKFTTTGDTYMPSVMIFSTDLYVPDICYDYAFSQNNRFFAHDTSSTAHIHGYLLNTEPLNTQIMFRNREAGTEAKNVSVRIENINSTNELEFYTDSQLELKKTLPESYYYHNVPSADITTQTAADLAFNWVTSTATLGYNESVFASFKLRPLVSGQVDVPLVMYVNYDYTLDDQTYSMTNLALDDRVPRCVAAPSEYNPIEWIFNVVDGGLNPGTPAEGVTNVKYNLPTQVAGRPVDIKVVSFDPNQLDRVKAINGMVAIELIDVAGYLDTESSCDDPNSAFTPRAWLQLGDIDQNVTTATLTQANFNTGLNEGVTVESFFGSVRENVAYRVSYNLADDNGSIKFDAMNGAQGIKYHLNNFPSYAGNQCASDIDGNPNSQDMVPQYCGDAGTSYASGMTGAELRTCMECIYGLKTKSVCSRDNFSIRPEAFKVEIRDPSGGVAISTEANLSAEYMYQFDANATNHIDNTPTSGYTAWFSNTATDRNVTLSWEPNGRVVSGCNDTASPLLDFYFANGRIIAQNRNHNNVGRYELRMRDSLWTAVDQSPAHHDNATNWISGNDCANGSAVPVYSSSNSYTDNLVGCMISSKHNKLSTPTATFDDYNLTFRPNSFIFGTGTQPFVNGLGKTAAAIAAGGSGFVYDSDLANVSDMNMSVRLEGIVQAIGANNGELSNFVNDCYASNLNFTLSHNANVALATPFVYRMINKDASNITTQMYDSGEINFNVTPLMSVDDGNFSKNGRGKMYTEIRVNYDRNALTPINPQNVLYNDLGVSCTDVNECRYQANGISDVAEGNNTLNFNVAHYYGRAQGIDSRISVANNATTAVGNVRIGFEVFCGNDGATNCNPTNLVTPLTLPSGRLAPMGEDRNWFKNLDHNTTVYGAGDLDGIISTRTANTDITVTQTTHNINGVSFAGDILGFQRYGASYNGNQGYPHRAIMRNIPEGWLIYNIASPGAAFNEFSLEFNKEGDWVGKSSTDTSSDSDASINSNRRIMW